MTRDRLSETLTGLDPWAHAELPDPPQPRGLQWLNFVGPGVIVLGLSLGGGEFLLGPTAFVRYGLSLLWITLVAVFFQTIFNTELMRYTVATGEPAFTGFMRTKPVTRVLGVVLRRDVSAAGWMAVFGRICPRARSSSSRQRRIATPAGRGDDLSARHRHLSSLHRAADAGPPDRAHARAAQLGDGGVHSRRLPCACAVLRASDRPGPPQPLGLSDSICRSGRSASCPATPISCCWPRSRAIRARAAW